MPRTSLPIPDDFAFSAGQSIELSAGDGSLTVESALDRVAFMRDFDISRDAKGLALAECLTVILAQIVNILNADQAAGKLPDVMPLIAPTERKNPF